MTAIYQTAAERRAAAEAELRAADEAERAEREELRKATPVRYAFTITQKRVRASMFDRVYDPTCTLYEFSGKVVNRDEATAAGHEEHELRDGGMMYLYNTVSQHIIMGVGGGTSYISPAWRNEDDYDVTAFGEISAFLAEHPEGGDITAIVERFREARGTF